MTRTVQTTKEATVTRVIKNGYEHVTWVGATDDYAHYCRYKVNPKTGKGWQASKNDKFFRGENAGAKAAWHMTKELIKSK